MGFADFGLNRGSLSVRLPGNMGFVLSADV